ncbi:MAG: 2-phosphosulfolactate phosphatase [Saprospiraceae bacterium]
MIINIAQGSGPVNDSADVNIIIDVIRAFTTSHIAFKKGVEKIFLVNEVEKAFSLKKENPHLFLAGEIEALPIPGFDFGNSPFEIQHTDQQLAGSFFVQKTTNGVKAVLNNLNAKTILVTGFQSADVVVKYIQHISDVQRVNLIASHPTGDDDLACAEYIKGKLLTQAVETSVLLNRVRNCHAAQKFYSNPLFNPKDIELAAQIDQAADFVMKVHCDGGLPFIQKIDISE